MDHVEMQRRLDAMVVRLAARGGRPIAQMTISTGVSPYVFVGDLSLQDAVPEETLTEIYRNGTPEEALASAEEAVNDWLIAQAKATE